MPFETGVIVNFKDSRFWTDFTVVNFTFDTREFATSIKNSYLNYLSDLSNFYPKELAKQLNNFRDSISRYEKVKEVLSQSSYYDRLRELKLERNKLEQFISNPGIDSSLIRSYEKIIDSMTAYTSLANEFERLGKFKDENKYLKEELDKYNNYIDSVKNTKDILTLQNARKDLEKAGFLNKSSKFFTGIQKLGIGRTALELTEFTSRNQFVYGFTIDYLHKNVLYTGAGVGLASPVNTQFNPTFNNIFQPPPFQFNRCIGYLRLGIGKPEENHLHLIYLSYGDKFNNTLTPTLNQDMSPAPANAVLSIDYKRIISKTIISEGEVAVSNASFNDRNATFSPLEVKGKKLNLNYAARLALVIRLEKSATQIGLKAMSVSPNFRTAGNVFQRRDFAEYSISLTQPVWKNKVQLTSVINHILTGIYTRNNRASIFITNTSVGFNPLTFLNLAISHQYLNQQTLQRYTITNTHTLGLLQVYSYGGKKCKANTQINFTYILTGNQMEGKSFSNQMLQIALNQNLQLQKGVNINIGAGAIVLQEMQHNKRISYWMETGNRFFIKNKCQLFYNIRYMTDYSKNPISQVNCGIQAQLYKGLELTVNEQLMVMPKMTNKINTQTTVAMRYSFAIASK